MVSPVKDERAEPETDRSGRVSLADVAYRSIRDQLIMLDIRPGAPINEGELTRTLGLGRTPVREALKRLETDRLVVAFPRRGTFATEVNITDLAHISEVRMLLEPAAARRASQRLNASDRAALTEHLAYLESDTHSQDPDTMLRFDLRVHRSIYTACHNPYLNDTLVRYDNLATRIWCLFLDQVPDVGSHVREHGPLIRAILAGDGEKAARLASAHVAGFEQAVRARIWPDA